MKRSEQSLWTAEPRLNGSMAGQFQRAALAISRMGDARRLIFTSLRGGAGTSVTTLNVGRELRRLGLKPLVVELNRVRPVFGARLSMSAIPGVAGLLTGTPISDAARADATGLPILAFTEPWASDASVARVASSVVEKTALFDVVLFDTPPLLESADTLAIGSVIRDTILVVRSGRTSADLLGAARQQCEDAGLRIRGSILSMQEAIVPPWMEKWLEGA